uniref:Uncharacterized protein n=1 Tax=Musa acuminata subsp. malaccensis TaxID=214687 RepID=A0A804J990_MUSAM
MSLPKFERPENGPTASTVRKRERLTPNMLFQFVTLILLYTIF